MRILPLFVGLMSGLLLAACGDSSGPQDLALELTISEPTVLERDGLRECYYTVTARLVGAQSGQWLFGSSAHRSGLGVESDERYTTSEEFQQVWGDVELRGQASRGIGRAVSTDTPRLGWEALEAWMVLVGGDTLQAQARRLC